LWEELTTDDFVDEALEDGRDECSETTELWCTEEILLETAEEDFFDTTDDLTLLDECRLEMCEEALADDLTEECFEAVLFKTTEEWILE
jgi:hypothetical protein